MKKSTKKDKAKSGTKPAPARPFTPEPWIFSAVDNGTFSIHRAATAPDPVAHDVNTIEEARLIAKAPELLALLEAISRAPFGQLGHGKAYLIADDTMNQARTICAQIVNPQTYVARQRVQAKPHSAGVKLLAEAVRLFDDVESSPEHPDPTDDGINCAREALRLLKS